MAQKKKKVNPEKNIRMNHNYVAIKKKKKQYFVLGSVNYCTSTIKIIFPLQILSYVAMNQSTKNIKIKMKTT